MEYRKGDLLQDKLVGNFAGQSDPHLFTIFKIESKNNCYHLRNLQTQEICIQSRQNLDTFFVFKGHTR